MKKILALLLVFVLVLSLLAACGGNGGGGATTEPPDREPDVVDNRNHTIIFGNAGWDSNSLHNAVAGFIAETAFGYAGWDEVLAASAVIHEALLRGDIDIHMENWVENMEPYLPDLEAGRFQELGINFNDNAQGFYVPRFVIEGDAARGIEPMAPTLRSVQDLVRYPHVFPDRENPGRGRIYGAIPGWMIDIIMHNKFIYNGLDAYFEYFRPGSEAAMNAVFSTAYERGEALVGYFWEPTWLMGLYDFVLLEDHPFTNEDDFQAGMVEAPPVTVTIGASNQFVDAHPEFSDFLRNYRTTSAQISGALAFMQETGADIGEAAIWFLQTHGYLLDEWLTPDQAQLVRDALETR